jgi:hypothetical protein
MQVSRLAAWMFAGAVATGWLASAAGVNRPARPPRTTPQRSPETVALDNLVADVQTQAGRLRKRLETAPVPTAPFRNPFSFAERSAPVARQSRSAIAPAPTFVPPPPVAVPEPSLQLIGIAEKKVGDVVVRTAMLAPGDADSLIMATAGQKILGAYEVVTIGVDAVLLKDLTTGEMRTLVLR